MSQFNLANLQVRKKKGQARPRAPPPGCDRLTLKFDNPSSASFQTLKALANFSPGLRFGNPGFFASSSSCRNSEGVATDHGWQFTEDNDGVWGLSNLVFRNDRYKVTVYKMNGGEGTNYILVCAKL